MECVVSANPAHLVDKAKQTTEDGWDNHFVNSKLQKSHRQTKEKVSPNEWGEVAVHRQEHTDSWSGWGAQWGQVSGMINDWQASRPPTIDGWNP